MADSESEETIALELRGLGKAYGRGTRAKRAVDDVSLCVRCGEVYGFLGPNGAGKSTTIRMALGLIRPSAGEAFVFGRHVTEKGALARVGSLVDGGTFYAFLSGRDNLRVLARTQGHDGERIEQVLERVDLSGDAHRKVKGYSTGMKQRLGVAAALLDNPDLVILDEPANGLDAAGIQDMRALIRGLAGEGKAVFLSSHLLHEVEQICDRVAVVNKGKLLREATVGELLAKGEVLRVDAEPADAAIAALGDRWPVEATDKGLSVRASRADTPEIVRLLTAAKVDVFAIGPDDRSLEEIFLTMTRDPQDA
ncbi:ABC transporter ATP-binding protein [Stakelama tenebrarum]|uniref:ABC transporter ATP-binding protein n=1 Tax=Stakelama tenebrarum TaxID=2711215 RepID=UPI0019D1305F|nr:ABC transporter ATP-binding protein [Sphingosinithalassobacter tenebrarum]